jgi:hypothetical protein
MIIIDSIFNFIESLDQKNFYKYLAIGSIIFFIVMAGLMVRHYYAIGSLRTQISMINSLREDAKIILDKAVVVEQQKKDVNAMIAQEPNFKIGGYMKELLEKNNLTEKKKLEQYIPVDRQDNYRETILTTQFTQMTMQELVILLDKIEQNELIYIKSLEISQSKTSGTIDTTLIIATLQPKEESTG